MIFSGCSICSRPDVGAINAALRTQSIRAVAAAYPGLSKSALGRHAKHADTPAPAAAPPNPQAPRVRHRTRPAALSCIPGAPGAASSVTDPLTRALQALWMRKAGKSWREIAAAFTVPEQTIKDDLARMRQAKIAEAQRTRAEDHVANVRATNRLLVKKLSEVHDRAVAKGDDRVVIDAIKELRQVNKQEAELLREFGAFDNFRPGANRKAQEATDGESLIEMVKDWAGLFAMDDTSLAERLADTDQHETADLDLS